MGAEILEFQLALLDDPALAEPAFAAIETGDRRESRLAGVRSTARSPSTRRPRTTISRPAPAICATCRSVCSPALGGGSTVDDRSAAGRDPARPRPDPVALPGAGLVRGSAVPRWRRQPVVACRDAGPRARRAAGHRPGRRYREPVARPCSTPRHGLLVVAPDRQRPARAMQRRLGRAPMESVARRGDAARSPRSPPAASGSR